MNRSIKAILIALTISTVALIGCGENNKDAPNNVIKVSAKRDLGKAKFTEILLNLEPIKQQVALCYNENGFTEDEQPECSSGAHGTVYRIPNAFSTTYFESITVENGSIVAIAKHVAGLEGESYILDPHVNGNSLEWELASDSTCIAKGYC